MNLGHTPGPWKAEGSERTLASWVKGPDGKRICTMRQSEHDWGNALAIAALPDVIAALEVSEATIRRLAKTDAALASCQGTLGLIAAAIAKARMPA